MTETQIQILENKVQAWQNVAYNAEIDVRIAERLDNAEMKKAALEQIKQAEKALDLLKELLSEADAPAS